MSRGELDPHAIVRLEDDAVVVLDQRRLPDEEVELRCATAAEVAEAIRVLAVRGAPAIGIAAAYGIALAAERGEDLDVASEALAASRPTAVNLRWALDADARRPDSRARRADPRGRGRALQADGRECGRALPERGARPHPLQRRRARDGRLRDGARRDPRRLGGRACRARLGRRDSPPPPGRAAHGLGARAPRDPARGDRRRGRRILHGPRRGRSRRHRSRPDRGERRHREQDRHLRARGARPAPRASRSSSSRRRPRSIHRCPPETRSRSRSATRAR